MVFIKADVTQNVHDDRKTGRDLIGDTACISWGGTWSLPSSMRDHHSVASGNIVSCQKPVLLV